MQEWSQLHRVAFMNELLQIGSCLPSVEQCEGNCTIDLLPLIHMKETNKPCEDFRSEFLLE